MPSPQEVQEREYCFPYHHIPICDGRTFRPFRIYPSAFEYISYCRLLTRRIADMAARSAIDVGCGDGRLCLELHQALPHMQVCGVDISERAIAFARLLAPGCQFICGDLSDPNMVRQRFDVATLVEVLEHIEPTQTPGFLTAIGRLLQPGGTLLVTVPSTQLPVSAKHFRHFDEPLLRQVLGSHFDIQEIVFMNRIGLRAEILYRLMSNNLFVPTNPSLLGWLLRYYERTLLPAGPRNCVRLLAVCRNRG